MKNKIGKTQTCLYTDNNGNICLKYQNTDVVKFNASLIELNTGGRFTPTTKRRMNEASNVFDLGFKVEQKRGTWLVDFKGVKKKFEENVYF